MSADVKAWGQSLLKQKSKKDMDFFPSTPEQRWDFSIILLTACSIFFPTCFKYVYLCAVNCENNVCFYQKNQNSTK